MTQALITCDLGFGDSGKGATVDALCRKHSANLVVRYSGGCQAGHNVQLPDGRRHCFSQWGAGTLAGAHTFLGPQMIIDPFAMQREAHHLRDVMDVSDPYDLLTVDPDCLVTTPIHVIKNLILHKRQNHGTCGRGIGAAREYRLKYGGDAIEACDLAHSPEKLVRKLQLLKDRTLHELEDIFWLGSDCKEEWYGLLTLNVGRLARELFSASEPLWLLKSPDRDWFTDTIIFEGAQGILLDQYAGFHPNTTWSDVTPDPAFELCDEWDISDYEVIGITRSYSTRHGNGPFPANDPFAPAPGVKIPGADLGNEPNIQGTFNSGPLDMVLLRYALSAVAPDSIAITCVDQFPGKVVEKYDCAVTGDNFCFPSTPYWTQPDQSRLNDILWNCRPVFKDVTDIVQEIAAFGIPISSTSNGPTFEHRTWRD